MPVGTFQKYVLKQSNPWNNVTVMDITIKPYFFRAVETFEHTEAIQNVLNTISGDSIYILWTR